jgi:hypothetical protein
MKKIFFEPVLDILGIYNYNLALSGLGWCGFIVSIIPCRINPVAAAVEKAIGVVWFVVVFCVWSGFRLLLKFFLVGGWFGGFLTSMFLI